MEGYHMKKWLSILLAVCLLMSACGALAEVTQEDIDAKYDPAIELTAWRFLSSAIQFENGDTIEDNIYIDRYLSDLGIKLTYDWVVAEEQFDQKMNVSIASGDLPDLMWLKAAQLKELAQEGDLYDLTELFDKYANQYAKDTLMADMKQFDTAKVDGKLRVFQRVTYAGSATLGKETLADTLPISGRVIAMELSGVGTITDSASASRLADLLLNNAQPKNAGASSGSQSLLIQLNNGLTLQMVVKNGVLSACGGWTCPEFFDAFEQAAK